ncbi:MAG: SpoIIE family protein phosphatase [Bacteroidota bacterium]
MRTTFYVKVITFFLSVCCIHFCYAQTDISADALPFIRNYSPKEYQAGVVNVDVKIDSKGFIYFANTQGVLRYDGKNWKTIAVPETPYIRSLDITAEDSIFVGAPNTIGKLEPDSLGVLQFRSLFELVEEKKRNFGEIWRIEATPQGVFFSTNNYIFRYKDGKIKTWTTEGKYFYLVYHVYDQVYILDSGIGIKRVEGDSLVTVCQEEIIASHGIYFMLPYTAEGEKEILLGADYETLRIYNPENNATRPFTSELEADDITAIYGGILGNDGNYYISTLRRGIICLSPQGKKLSHLTNQSGLEADKVYGAAFDSQNNLWLALVKGAAKVELGSPFRKFDGISGLSGIVTAKEHLNGKTYIGTTDKVYEYHSGQFEELEGNHYQTWSIRKIPTNADTTLLVSTNVGINEISDKGLDLIQELSSSVVDLVPSKQHEGRVYAGLQNNGGLIQLNYSRNRINDVKQVLLKTSISELEILEDLLFVLNRENQLKVFIEKDSLTEKITLDQEFITLERHQNTVFASTASAVYHWDGNDFQLYEPLTSKLKELKLGVSELFSVDQNTIAFSAGNIKNRFFYVFNTQTEELKKLPTDRITRNFITIYKILPSDLERTGQLAIATSDGLFFLDMESESYTTSDFKTLIRRVLQRSDTLFVGNYTESNRNPSLEANQNSLTFFFSSTNSFDEENTLFRYRLNGYEESWSEWTSESKKEYTNLDAGGYSFEVESRNVYGVSSPSATYAFSIKAPFYKTPFAYLIYILVSVLLVGIISLLVTQYNTQRLKATNEKLEEVVQKRTAELQLTNSELEQQKEEITAQKQSIEAQKEELERSYRNIQTLADIGQNITATLDLTGLTGLLYENVNSLMDAEGFGIGVYNKERQQIEFRGFMESGAPLPFHADTLEEHDKLAIQCFLNQEEIFTNDVPAEFPEHNVKVEIGISPQSLIYLPLVVQEKPVGVLTVQSLKGKAYEERQLTILRSLASYAAIAVSNAQSYRTITDKNKSITDSIRYAQSIQAAVLPSEDEMKRHLSELFILFRPKDIVSGDFYWFTVSEGKVFIAVVDCTGHGVPGAFMSLIGNTFLHEIIIEKEITAPDQILEELDKTLKNALQEGKQTNKDGMDLALCVLEDKGENTHLSFAGAKRPLWYALPEQGALNVVGGTRRSVGSTRRIKGRAFESHHMTLPKGTQLYFTTDGFADQSNISGVRLGSHRVKEIIEEHLSLPLEEQYQNLVDTLDEHQGRVEQRDDITVLGIKL